MHKKKSDTFAFTKNIDDAMKSNPTIKESMGIDNVSMRVSPDNGDEPYSIKYKTKDTKEDRIKYAMIYHRKPTGQTTKSKREKWARNGLLPGFNRYDQAKHSLCSKSNL